MTRRRLCEVFLASDTDLLRIVVGLYTVIFGIWLLLPPPFSINPAMKALDGVAPLAAWTTVTITLGLVRIYGAMTDGVQSYWFYRSSSLFDFLLWSFYTGWSFLFAATVVFTIPAIVPLNVLIALTSGGLYLRGGWDQKRMDLRATRERL